MKIIAHMGASQEAPENTLPAFEKAIELNADVIEFDVRITQDNIPLWINNYYIFTNSPFKRIGVSFFLLVFCLCLNIWNFSLFRLQCRFY